MRYSIKCLLIAVAFAAALFFARQSEATPQNSLAVVSAASYKGDALAAEEIGVAFGTNLAASILIANTLPLPKLARALAVTGVAAVGSWER